MRTDGLATRMAVLGGALPTRILIVDDDELELALIADRLTTAGFEVARASNGDEALLLLEQQWFPVVITDWQMPVMDGIAFTEALRARGNEETYVIMLTMRESGMDYERGYHSGVNDYLTKKLPDAELFARINAAFNTLALRRSLSHVQSALQAATIDPQSGAFALEECLHKLESEIKRAQRYGRVLSIMTLGVHPVGELEESASPALKPVIEAVQATIRTHVDWIGRLDVSGVFVIVLPETGAAGSVQVRMRICAALRTFVNGSYGGPALRFDYGVASIQPDGAVDRRVGMSELLAVAEKCRSCPGHRSPIQLETVQSSVSSGAAIVCRHGYAVDEHCTLKIEPEYPVVADPRATRT